MAEIRSDAAEYATVERLAEMLDDLHEQYLVTEAYALFTTILCWVMQRVRTPGAHARHDDKLARQAGRRLSEQLIQDSPWDIECEHFRGVSAFYFFKVLRDAAAHGDARSVEPINHNGLLVGQRFYCRPDGKPAVQIDLHRNDFQRLGRGLADLYCEAMRSVAESGEQLKDHADELQEEEMHA